MKPGNNERNRTAILDFFRGIAAPVHIVVMGVSGSGKTTTALALKKVLQWPYAEADDFHPAANIEKMRVGTPLTDEDRLPWLISLTRWMSDKAKQGQSTIVTCSALKRSYRDILRRAEGKVLFVQLNAEQQMLRERMEQREHFMPPSLLASQCSTLEPLDGNECGIVISSSENPDDLAQTILNRLAVLCTDSTDTDLPDTDSISSQSTRK